MTSKKQAAADDLAAKRAELYAAYETARAFAKANPSVAAWEAVKAAWAACVAAAPRQKVSGYASRAGQRQQAERRAQAAERMPRYR